MYYHVISYVIFITLTTLYCIRLLIITYVEKLHSQIKTHYLKRLERQRCAHARHGNGTLYVLAVPTTAVQLSSTLKYVGRNT